MSYGLSCPACAGLRTAVLEALPDPEHPAGGRKWRIRECLDCGARIGTEERVVSIDLVRARRAALAAERRLLARLFDAALHRGATIRPRERPAS